jgi:hypothetical protein
MGSKNSIISVKNPLFLSAVTRPKVVRKVDKAISLVQSDNRNTRKNRTEIKVLFNSNLTVTGIKGLVTNKSIKATVK